MIGPLPDKEDSQGVLPAGRARFDPGQGRRLGRCRAYRRDPELLGMEGPHSLGDRHRSRGGRPAGRTRGNRSGSHSRPRHRAPNDMLWSLSSNSGAPAEAIQGIDPMLPVLQTLAQTQARIGDLDAALKTIADMGVSTYATFYRNNTIEQIVATRLEAGDVPRRPSGCGRHSRCGVDARESKSKPPGAGCSKTG